MQFNEITSVDLNTSIQKFIIQSFIFHKIFEIDVSVKRKANVKKKYGNKLPNVFFFLISKS